jgi:hypothetical protein
VLVGIAATDVKDSQPTETQMTGSPRSSRIDLIGAIAAAMLVWASFLPRAAAVAGPAVSYVANAQTANTALRASTVTVDITPDGSQWLGGYAPRRSTGIPDGIRWFGYLPTARGFEEGGYEPRTSPFTPQVEADVLAAAIAAVHDLRR